MKVVIKTNLLKTLLGKVSKGADEQGLQHISTCVSIEIAGKDLILRTTNKTHLLKVTQPGLFTEDKDFYACVPNQLFSKLISKMTTENIELEVTDKLLNVKGNGDYSIPLSFDVDGTVCRIQDIPFEESAIIYNENGAVGGKQLIEPVAFELTLEQMKDILNYNAASAERTTAVAGSVLGYYVDKYGFITYDSTACLTNLQLSDVKGFMPTKTLELCEIFTGAKVKFELLPTIVRVSSENDELIYKLQDPTLAEQYPVDAIRGLAENEFNGSCKVNKTDLLDALDRLSLFVKIGPTQVLARIRVMFDKDKLTLFDPYGKNIETLKVTEMTGNISFTQDLDLFFLKSLLSCHTNDSLQLSYGNDVGIMITDKNIIQLIPYLEEDPNLSRSDSSSAEDEDSAFASIAVQEDEDSADEAEFNTEDR